MRSAMPYACSIGRFRVLGSLALGWRLLPARHARPTVKKRWSPFQKKRPTKKRAPDGGHATRARSGHCRTNCCAQIRVSCTTCDGPDVRNWQFAHLLTGAPTTHGRSGGRVVHEIWAPGSTTDRYNGTTVATVVRIGGHRCYMQTRTSGHCIIPPGDRARASVHQTSVWHVCDVF